MGRLKIGAVVDGFGLGVRGGIEKCRELGLDGFQIYTTYGEMTPENLSAGGRREFLKFVQDRDLVLSALCGDYGQDLTDADRNNKLIPKIKTQIDLAVDLRTTVVTTHIGVISEDENDKQRAALAEALREINAHAATREVCLAAETGPESGAVMKAFFYSLGTDFIKVNFDPANLVMNGFDPVAGVLELRDYIVHTHAKDGRRDEDGRSEEVLLGQGQVPFGPYVETLDLIGYDGFYVIEREGGEDRVADITQAAEFLRRF